MCIWYDIYLEVNFIFDFSSFDNRKKIYINYILYIDL